MSESRHLGCEKNWKAQGYRDSSVVGEDPIGEEIERTSSGGNAKRVNSGA